MIVPAGLPPSIRDACEPCRALPRAPGATWERSALDADARWALLRASAATNAIKWPKLVAGTPREAHVGPLLRRFDESAPPKKSLSPEIEATWLWLETVKASKPSDIDEQVMDFLTTASPAVARSTGVEVHAGLAPLRAYLFPEEEAWSNELARLVKTPNAGPTTAPPSSRTSAGENWLALASDTNADSRILPIA